MALIVALMAMALMSALGMALMLMSQTETMISANYRDSMEGQYAADAGIERVMDDVLTVPDWNTLLASTDGITSSVTSGFIDTHAVKPGDDARRADDQPGSATNMINCGKIDRLLGHRHGCVDDGSAVGQEQSALPLVCVGPGERPRSRPARSIRRSTSPYGLRTTPRRTTTTRRRMATPARRAIPMAAPAF